MNTKNMWITAISGAVLTTVVSNLPFVGLVNCLLCAGFWVSAIFAVWLYRHLSGALTIGQGIVLGALTGLCAGVLGFALSFVGLVGAQGFLTSYSWALPADALKGMQDIPAWGGLVFNLVGVLFNVIFGTVGGWIGGMIFRTNREARKPGR